MYVGAILIASDKGARGERQDESGQAVQECLASLGVRWAKYEVVPDDMETISATLKDWADEGGLDVVFTSGGTGLAPRDVTPEATLAVVERLVPGIAEAMRVEGVKKTPLAMLSRGVAGIRKGTLIVNLPGSPRAVRECLEAVLPALPHAMETLRGEAAECGQR
ncbi:MAG: molybdenum cofactor biosynthesis protein [Chloroflexi bacterium]|nr:MAG: molybdenum cofactor biosynthesis protein [Chloroflexota bacterium]